MNSSRRTALITVSLLLLFLCSVSLLGLLYEAAVYALTMYSMASLKADSFVGTAIILLVPVLWGARSIWQRKWWFVVASLSLLLLISFSAGCYYHRESASAKTQLAAFDTFILEHHQYTEQLKMIDMATITPDTYGPLVNIVAVVAEQANREIVARIAFDQQLVKCGIDGTLLAPATFARKEDIRTTRRNLAEAMLVVQQYDALRIRLIDELIQALETTDAPPDFRSEMTGRMRQSQDSTVARLHGINTALLAALRASDDLYADMENRANRYVIIDGQFQFADDESNKAYVLLYETAQDRFAKYDDLCDGANVFAEQQRAEYVAGQ